MDDKTRKVGKQQIQQYPIIVTTLCTAAQLLKMNLENHFDTVIIDEAGQATEVETYIPLTMLSPQGQVILAGDHLQLGACTFATLTKKFNLRKSLLERLVTTNECYNEKMHGNEMRPFICTFLKKNYRSVKSILKLSNELFYNNQLEDVIDEENSPDIHLLNYLKANVLRSWKTPVDNNCGVFFIDVHNGHNSRMRKNKIMSKSWKNEKELDELQNILSKLDQDKEVKASDLGIVSA